MLLSLILLLYLSFGAALFNYLERDNEIREKSKYAKLLKSVRASLCGKDAKQCNDLDRLLELHGNLSAAGLLSQRERFDISGAFFFAGTLISTIGFGISTPRTTIGRMSTIIYGVIGCTCCVLFFNLFLERVITVLTFILSCLDGIEDFWRPSLYKVFAILFTICGSFMFISAYFYSATEGWSYTDSLYFCFIGFGTIGFGDFVPNQQVNYKYSSHLIRLANFFILSFGASSVYCLFNVSSIVVRQLLNWLIKRIDIKINDPVFCWRRKPQRYMGLGLRPPQGLYISENDNGDVLLSLKDFLMNNRNSIVELHKQLIKSAEKNTSNEDKITANRVGPMGMLNEAFGDI
uniref:Potassium channel domain-containing protein n=1 Tax=Ascaris lumbricoides TaxID=6252 RepID=A0A9J2Q2Q4_ASCLU